MGDPSGAWGPSRYFLRGDLTSPVVTVWGWYLNVTGVEKAREKRAVVRRQPGGRVMRQRRSGIETSNIVDVRGGGCEGRDGLMEVWRGAKGKKVKNRRKMFRLNLA